MSHSVSPSTQRKYGLKRVCQAWKQPRSTVYAKRAHAQATESRAPGEADGRPARKRGPIGACSDDELRGHIREALADSPWVGEGYRKVWARLRKRGLRTAARRVLRVMRQSELLASQRPTRRSGSKTHEGSITPLRPDEIWGTDATCTLTDEGSATIFFVIDHCTAECLGIHAARRGTRHEALEPIRQAVHATFGGFDRAICAEGLTLRHDNGSQFVSGAYQDEIQFLGLRSSPSFVREPQGNGCAERFVRTLKEQLLWLERFPTIESLRAALKAFQARYNEGWLIQRHGYRTPAEFRQQFAQRAAA